VAETGARGGTRTGFEDFVRCAKDGVYVKLRVSPGAKNTGIKGLYGERALRLSVAAPPAEGRANAEIERYLARLLEVSRSGVVVVKGAEPGQARLRARFWGGRIPGSSKRSSLKGRTYLRTSSNLADC
jgi:uncharacterized protein